MVSFLINLDKAATLWIYSLSGKSVIIDLVGHFLAEYLIFVMIAAVGIWASIGYIHPAPEATGLPVPKGTTGLPVGLHSKGMVFSRGIYLVLTAVLSQIWKPLISHTLFFRARPELVHFFTTVPYDAAFPSNHASASFALASVVWHWQRKRNWFTTSLFVSAVLVSLGRVFAGFHYVSDIVAGAALGLVSAWIVKKGMQKMDNSKFEIRNDSHNAKPKS